MRPIVVIFLVIFFAIFLAAGCFAQSEQDRPWQLITHALQDGNPIKRSAAMLAMGVVLPRARAVKLIEEGLADKDSGVRQSACAVLGGIQSLASAGALREELNDPTPEVVFACAKALYDLRDPAGRQVLVAVLAGDQPDASGFFSSSVRDAKLKLHDPKGLLLIGAKEGAGFLAGPFGAGIPIAEGFLKDKQASGKTIAALLLATDKSAGTEEALQNALGDKNWTVRVAALRAVALRDARTLAITIAPLLDDKREEVQYQAAATLIRLQQVPLPRPARKAAAPARKTP